MSKQQRLPAQLRATFCIPDQCPSPIVRSGANRQQLYTNALIWQHPDAARADIPIPAPTANAFQTDHEKYPAAGMNDCRAKPLAEAGLYAQPQKLLRH